MNDLHGLEEGLGSKRHERSIRDIDWLAGWLTEQLSDWREGKDGREQMTERGVNDLRGFEEGLGGEG